MSVQRWAPVHSLQHRLCLCGHTFAGSCTPYGPNGDIPCKICGRKPATGGQRLGCPDYVPTAALTWGTAQISQEEAIKVRSQGYIETVQDLLYELSCTGASHIQLQQRTVTLGPEPDSNAYMLVMRSSSRGAVVRSGDVALPVFGVVLLEGTGATFEDVTFSGGALVCAGHPFAGTFRRCTFRCDVCVVHGARATFSACTFRSSGFGLTASGHAAHATVDGCTFHDCPASILAEAGAAITADTTRVFGSDSAITINGAGSHVSLTDCTTHGGGAASRSAVTACDGAAALSGCRLACSRAILRASGPAATIDARDMHAEEFTTGIIMSRRARVSLADAHFSMRGHPSTQSVITAGTLGAGASGAGGTRLQLERCRFHGGGSARSQGFTVRGGSSLAARQCRLECSGDALYADSRGSRVTLHDCEWRCQFHLCRVLSSGCTLALHGCSLTSGGKVCWADNGATVIATDCTLQGQSGGGDTSAAACEASGGAKAALLRCVLRRAPIGLHCNRSTASAKECRVCELVNETGPAARPTLHPRILAGIAYQSAAGRLSVEGGSVEGCLTGAIGGGTPLESGDLAVLGVEFSCCALGVQTYENASVRVANCQFRGERHPRQHRVMYQKSFAIGIGQVRGSVTGCTFENYFKGIVNAAAPWEVGIRDCEFRDMFEGGACIDSGAQTLVDGCRFMKADQCVVGVGGKATVRDCAFGPDVAFAVVVNGGATVSTLNCRFRDCANAMLVTLRGCLAAQDCECVSSDARSHAIRAEEGAFSVTAKRVTSAGGYAGVAIESLEGLGGSVKLVDCKLSGAEYGVDLQGPGLQGSLLRCDTARCTRGIVVTRAAVVRARQCNVSRCKYGVFLGSSTIILEAGCNVCGLAGDAAVNAALAYAEGPERSAPSGRCEHTGAMSMVTLEDVQVSDSAVAGVTVECMGHVDALRVHASNCGAGFTEHARSARSRFSECTVKHRPGQTASMLYWHGKAPRARNVKDIPGIQVV
eukprot:jgi/Ulvmu1/5848/UM025_0107.1